MEKTLAGPPALRNNFSLFVTLLATGLVAACGGGGGGGDSGLTRADATVIIDENNAVDVVRNVEDSNAFARSIVLGLLVDAATVSSASVSASQTNSGDGPELNSAAASAEFCNGGEADVNESDLIVIFSFFDCQDFNYTSDNLGNIQFPGLLDGMLQVEVSAQSSSETDFQATITLTNFSVTNESGTEWGNGSLNLDYLETSSSIIVDITTGALDMEMASATRSLTAYRYFLVTDAIEETVESDGGLTSSDFDFLAYFETPQPFVTDVGDSWPTAGRRVIYGANQARVRVTPQGDGLNARVELDVDGTEGFETSCTYSWEELLGDDPIIACAD